MVGEAMTVKVLSSKKPFDGYSYKQGVAFSAYMAWSHLGFNGYL
jgi:hypothetical protein